MKHVRCDSVGKPDRICNSTIDPDLNINIAVMFMYYVYVMYNMLTIEYKGDSISM